MRSHFFLRDTGQVTAPGLAALQSSHAQEHAREVRVDQRPRAGRTGRTAGRGPAAGETLNNPGKLDRSGQRPQPQLPAPGTVAGTQICVSCLGPRHFCIDGELGDELRCLSSWRSRAEGGRCVSGPHQDNGLESAVAHEVPDRSNSTAGSVRCGTVWARRVWSPSHTLRVWLGSAILSVVEMQASLTRSEMERDKIGWCSCGRAGAAGSTARGSVARRRSLKARSVAGWCVFASTPVRHERVEYRRG